MKKKSGGGEGGGANWMDTYGDMVTLLLCFFVLLYSISTVDENKWKAMVQSFNPNATPAETEIKAGNEKGPFADPNEDNAGITDPAEAELKELEEKQEEIADALEQLYQALQQVKEESGVNVEITKGDGFVFISLSDTVFFDGDSSTLREDGAQLLDKIAPMLSAAAPYIDELRIMGHTAQAEDTVANEVEGDRNLSAVRASVVTAYLQQKVPEINPARMVSQGYGQHRPIAENKEGERWKNRRVEMVVTGENVIDKMGDAIEQYEAMRKGETIGQASSSGESSETNSSSASESSSGSQGTSQAESGGESQEG